MKPELTIIKSFVLVFCLSLAAFGCSEESNDTSSSTIAQCADGIDNDSDSLTDLNDSGCSNAADDDESDDPVSQGHDAERANSYDDAWEPAWVANAKTILSTNVGITKEDGKVLQVGDSMTYSFNYGDWARKKNAATATASDLDVMNWLHAGVGDLTDGWELSSNGRTAQNGAGWGSGFVDNISSDAELNDAQFAVVMFNLPNSSDPADLTIVEQRVHEFMDAGIVPVLSTIPPRKPDPGFDYNKELAEPYNTALYAMAEALSLPIIDFYEEILLRRPGDTWIFTLIGREATNVKSEDGVHPAYGVNGYTPISDPYADGGDVLTHTTGDAALNSGYLLRTWLTVQKMKEIKQKVVD